MFLRRARWITDKYILVMLGLFPLFFGFTRNGYTHMTQSKFWFFTGATGLWLVLVCILLAAAAIRKEKFMPAVRPAHIAVALFLLFSAVSAVLSEYGTECLVMKGRFDGLVLTTMYCIVFFGVSMLSSPKPRYAWALGISATLCCVVALVQMAGYDPFWLYPEGLNYYDKYESMNGAFLGTIGNVGLLSAFLCAAGPFLTVYAILSERRADTFLLLPGALSLGVLCVCDVDAGLVALLGCTIVTIPVVIRNKRASCTAGCISGGLTLAGLAGVFFWPGTSGTVWEFSQILHGHLADEFGSHRGQIWKACWELFKEKPWFGGGPATIMQRLDITWNRYIEALGRDRSVYVDNAHNVFLGYLVNIGLFGALSYVAAALCTLGTWLSRRRDGALYPALGSAFLCYMIQDFFGIGICISAPVLWIVWGLLESTPEPEGKHVSGNSDAADTEIVSEKDN